MVQYDASHFGDKGQILDINSKALKGSENQLTDKANLKIDDLDMKNVKINKIGSARNEFLFF